VAGVRLKSPVEKEPERYESAVFLQKTVDSLLSIETTFFDLFNLLSNWFVSVSSIWVAALAKDREPG
jgi:hypothetical protein